MKALLLALLLGIITVSLQGQSFDLTVSRVQQVVPLNPNIVKLEAPLRFKTDVNFVRMSQSGQTTIIRYSVVTGGNTFWLEGTTQRIAFFKDHVFFIVSDVEVYEYYP